jgi:WD40-like Beta Propeller Repeat
LTRRPARYYLVALCCAATAAAADQPSQILYDDFQNGTWSVNVGDPLNPYNLTGQYAAGPSFSKDGTRIAEIVSSDLGVHESLRIMDRTGTPLRADIPNVFSNDTAWSPDGTEVAIACRSQASAPDGICVVNVDTGETRQILELPDDTVKLAFGEQSVSWEGTTITFTADVKQTCTHGESTRGFTWQVASTDSVAGGLHGHARAAQRRVGRVDLAGRPAAGVTTSAAWGVKVGSVEDGGGAVIVPYDDTHFLTINDIVQTAWSPDGTGRTTATPTGREISIT